MRVYIEKKYTYTTVGARLFRLGAPRMSRTTTTFFEHARTHAPFVRVTMLKTATMTTITTQE